MNQTEYQEYLKDIRNGNIDPKYYSNIPEEYLTEELYLEMINQNRDSILKIPENKITKKIIERAIFKSGLSILQSLSSKIEDLVTEDIFLKYIEEKINCCYNISWIPNKFRTYELYLKLIKEDKINLRDIPYEFRTYELCLEMVKCKYFTEYNIPYIPREYFTEELCLTAIKNKGCAIEFIPSEYITYDMALTAVKTYYKAFKYICKEDITEEMAIASLENIEDLNSLSHLPEQYRTEEFLLKAITKNKSLFKILNKIMKYENFEEE